MAEYCLVVWYYMFQYVRSVNKSRKRRMNIICNELRYRSLERPENSSKI